jgi:hypothetical protein
VKSIRAGFDLELSEDNQETTIGALEPAINAMRNSRGMGIAARIASLGAAADAAAQYTAETAPTLPDVVLHAASIYRRMFWMSMGWSALELAYNTGDYALK